MYDKNNVFAKIIRGEIPSKRIYENAYAISFYDIDPAATVHALIIPRGEYENILDFSANASDDEKLGLFDCLNQTVAKLGVSDCNIFANTGKAVYIHQSVPHFHMHIVAGEKIKEITTL